MKTTMKLLAIAASLALVAIAGFAALTGGPASANHTPANKTTASAASIEFLTTAEGGEVEEKVLATRMRTNQVTDLILEVSSECALWTSTATEDTDASETRASVEMYLKVAGSVVPVTNDSNADGRFDDPDDGRVVFCNRAHRMETEFIDGNDDDTLRIRSFLKTRTANSFTWLLLNAGKGIIDIELWAVLDAEVFEEGDISASFGDVGSPAAAGIGKRTLIIEPTKTTNDANH